jgi:hypothetical protein
MKTHHRSHAEAFLSLDWYEIALRFFFRFVAKTSEVLLAAGLVVSTANFLSDGSLLATYPNVSVAWSWAQAIAIDSSLGVSLASTFEYLKEGAWIKGTLYGLLTILLALVAGAITTVDIVSHALHIPTGDAILQMSLNISMISRLRAIAVIGFMLMSRIRDLPLPNLLAQEEEPVPPPTPSHTELSLPKSSAQAVVQSLRSQFSAQELAQIVNACLASGIVTLTPSQRTVPVPQQSQYDPQKQGAGPSEKLIDAPSVPRGSVPMEPPSEPGGAVPERSSGTVPVPDVAHQPVPVPTLTSNGAVSGEERSLALQSGEELAQGSSKEPVPDPAPEEELSLERDQRLEQAYQFLLAEGKKPSGRALAEQVHIHRATCVAWLREKQRQSMTNALIEESADDREVTPDVPDPGSILEPLALVGDLLMETGDASPGVPPASHLPEDTPPL